ncbi:aspartate/glutamate racemase family protein [Roseovarius sp.]|uniref:aspartate/glutamate racemase family protein n=1 Tax=Roseovarius sp. TaxID=1486281 RepID=UPI0035663D8E
MRICFLGTDARLDYLRGFASAGVTLDNMADFIGTAPRPSSVESRGEELGLALWVIEQVVEAERRGFDAVITGCFSDPGVEAARERVVIPVIGPGEAALYTARMLAHHFSVVTPLPETVPLAREQAHRTGMYPFIASIVSFDLSVEAIRERDPATIARLIDVCRACVEDDGAEAIVCGCASMSLLSDEIAAEIGVPVLNSVRLSLRAAEMMVGAGLSHSKKTFPVPMKSN